MLILPDLRFLPKPSVFKLISWHMRYSQLKRLERDRTNQKYILAAKSIQAKNKQVKRRKRKEGSGPSREHSTMNLPANHLATQGGAGGGRWRVGWRREAREKDERGQGRDTAQRSEKKTASRRLYNLIVLKTSLKSSKSFILADKMLIILAI